MIPCVIVQLRYISSSNSNYYYYVTPTIPRFDDSPKYPYDQMKSYLDFTGRWAYWSPFSLELAFTNGQVRSIEEIKPDYPGPRNIELQYVTEFDPQWAIERMARKMGTYDSHLR